MDYQPLPNPRYQMPDFSKRRQQPGTLHVKTLELLLHRPHWMTHGIISNAVATSCVKSFWLTNFAQGIIVAPDVDGVQALYEYLSGKKLVIE